MAEYQHSDVIELCINPESEQIPGISYRGVDDKGHVFTCSIFDSLNIEHGGYYDIDLPTDKPPVYHPLLLALLEAKEVVMGYLKRGVCIWDQSYANPDEGYYLNPLLYMTWRIFSKQRITRALEDIHSPSHPTDLAFDDVSWEAWMGRPTSTATLMKRLEQLFYNCVVHETLNIECDVDHELNIVADQLMNKRINPLVLSLSKSDEIIGYDSVYFDEFSFQMFINDGQKVNADGSKIIPIYKWRDITHRDELDYVIAEINRDPAAWVERYVHAPLNDHELNAYREGMSVALTSLLVNDKPLSGLATTASFLETRCSYLWDDPKHQNLYRAGIDAVCNGYWFNGLRADPNRGLVADHIPDPF